MLVTSRGHRVHIRGLSHDTTIFGHREFTCRIQNLRDIGLVSARTRDGVDLVFGTARNTILGSLRTDLGLYFVSTRPRSGWNVLLLLWSLFISDSKKIR